jgi:hypothetical protein
LATRLAGQYLEVLGKRFSNLSSLIEKHIHDPRKAKGKKYSLPDLLISTISMFALQQGSRHSYNQDRLAMSENFRNILNVKLAHGDTCEDLLRKVDPEKTNRLLASLVSSLIESKVFAPFRYQGKYLVAIDATGVHSFSDDQQGTALSKTSKNDVVSYSSAVLEAKLVGENGFAISLCQEWISNVGSSSNKQDCEQNAFVRLSEKLKILYPRLPMILLGDALYMSDPVVNRCKENQWDFIIVQKNNGSDYTRKEIELRPDKVRIQKGNEYFEYLNELDYNKHRISWLSYKNYAAHFAWYTSLKIEAGILENLSTIARSRWKIENQGFDQQKNHGYNLQHQHSRISPTARYNYYILLQIAHLINQLVVLELRFKAETKRCTRKKIWEYFRAFLQNPIAVLTMLRHYCTRKQHIYKE